MNPLVIAAVASTLLSAYSVATQPEPPKPPAPPPLKRTDTARVKLGVSDDKEELKPDANVL